MSTFEPPMIQDIKLSSPAQNADKDVEGVSPPSYPLHETEELVVGGPGHRGQRLIHWFRARRNRRHACCSRSDGCPKTVGARIVRGVTFFFAIFALLGLVHLAMLGLTTRKALKSLKCVAITPSQLQDDGLAVTIPFRHSKHIIVHPSLSGGDSLIMHDENVPKGTVEVSVTFANGTTPDAVYDGCVTKVWGGTVVGLIPREGKRAMISTFTIRVPPSLNHPSVRFLGSGDKKISDKKLKKLIRWWRKQQDKKKKNKNLVESAD